MSQRTVYEVQQGETHRVRITSPLGSTFTATCTATLHALPGGRTSSVPNSTVAATYTVSDYAGDATYGPGFNFVLSAATTAGLSPGTYIASPLISYTSPEVFVDAPLAWIVTVLPLPS